jgi:hypothetical protein
MQIFFVNWLQIKVTLILLANFIMSEEYAFDDSKDKEKYSKQTIKINDGFKIKRHIENNGFHR